MADFVRRVARRLLRRNAPGSPPLVLGFGDWGSLTGPTLAVCHPGWRGVRTATHAFGDPVVESDDLLRDAPEIVANARGAGVGTVVVHAFPPGADRFLEMASSAGLGTRAVVHSSMTQHGGEAFEAAFVSRIVDLASSGVIDRIGFVKAGMAEAFAALGIPASHTPNRAPRLPEFERIELTGAPPRIGVFAKPFWRKNVVTQLGAVAILGGTAHVMEDPEVGYLDGLPMVVHGELPWERFVALQASVDLNLYVSLSECHPMSPMESYLAGVPCLISPTSEVFADDPALRDLTTVVEIDDPRAIARAARSLMDGRDAAIPMARAWIKRFDRDAARHWADFTTG
ncbi:MAG TPA: hypothetical protein VK960_01180 [Acidimicrobiia bacterium]|nr:hypothetical protein [Acidimicrobiia bacterium]